MPLTSQGEISPQQQTTTAIELPYKKTVLIDFLPSHFLLDRKQERNCFSARFTATLPLEFHTGAIFANMIFGGRRGGRAVAKYNTQHNLISKY